MLLHLQAWRIFRMSSTWTKWKKMLDNSLVCSTQLWNFVRGQMWAVLRIDYHIKKDLTLDIWLFFCLYVAIFQLIYEEYGTPNTIFSSIMWVFETNTYIQSSYIQISAMTGARCLAGIQVRTTAPLCTHTVEYCYKTFCLSYFLVFLAQTLAQLPNRNIPPNYVYIERLITKY